jgi:hypothetical protein
MVLEKKRCDSSQEASIIFVKLFVGEKLKYKCFYLFRACQNDLIKEQPSGYRCLFQDWICTECFGWMITLNRRTALESNEG